MVVEEKGSKESNASSDDCYKIKQKTHEDLEIEIQTNRVLTVLDETICKIKIAAQLSYLCQNNGEILARFLLPDEVHFIVSACEFFLDALPSEDDNRSVILSTTDTTSAKFHERSLLMKEKYDLNLMRTVDMIYANQNLVNFIENNVDIQMDDLSSSLVHGMIELKGAAKDKLSSSAADERDYEKKLKDAWKDNIEAKQLIEGLEERLNKQTDELNVQLEAKENLIRMYMEKIEATRNKFNEDIKKRVTSAEKEMIQESKISEERQQNLAQEAKDSTQAYNVLLDQHLAAEKVLRGKRFKVEAQLGSWLEKYDKEIGDRQAELEALQAEYDSEKAEMDALQAKIDEQEEEYLELMAEKKEYDDDQFNKRYYEFILNRSVRIIQRAWRAYKERKRQRKLAKKQKKKKVKEEPPPPEPEPEPDDPDLFGDDADADDQPPVDAAEPADDDKKGKKGKGGKGKKGKAAKKSSTVISGDVGDAPASGDPEPPDAPAEAPPENA